MLKNTGLLGCGLQASRFRPIICLQVSVGSKNSRISSTPEQLTVRQLILADKAAVLFVVEVAIPLTFRLFVSFPCRMSLNAESCPVCFNLEPDQFPEKSQPGLLDEHRLVVPFSQVKSSAKNSDCLSCQIICVGLENIERDWEEGTEPDNTVDQILRDETLLLINLRLGRSLRVTLSNDWYETTLEFYTLSEAGMKALYIGRVLLKLSCEL